jgi:hypothetical protein
MRRLALLVFAVSGCGAPTLLPDGGRPVYGCHQQTAKVSVKVVDTGGNSVSGATVTAINVGSGAMGSYTTDGSGVTTGITDSYAPGVVRIQASSSGRQSPDFDVNFTCDTCTCTVSPIAVTLTVE